MKVDNDKKASELDKTIDDLNKETGEKDEKEEKEPEKPMSKSNPQKVKDEEKSPLMLETQVLKNQAEEGKAEVDESTKLYKID